VSHVAVGLVRPGDAPVRPVPKGHALERRVRERRAPVGRVREDLVVTSARAIVETAGRETRRSIVPVVAPMTVQVLAVERVAAGQPAPEGEQREDLDVSTVAMIVAMIGVMTGGTTGGTIVVGRHRGPVRVVSHLVRLVTKTGRRRTRLKGVGLRCALVVPARFARVSSRHESSALRRSGSTRAQCVRLPSRRPNGDAKRRRLRSVETSNVPENLRPMWRPRSTTSSNHVVRPV
jgi:hypothetical protein